MKKILRQIKKTWQDQRTQTALVELKKIAQKQPKKFILDACTLFTTAKSFEDHSLIGNQVLNHLGLHRFRVQVAAQFAQKRRAKLGQYLDAKDVAEFEKNGFIVKKDYLPQAEFESLKAELLATPLNTREMLQGDTVTRRMALDAEALARLPHTQQLLHSMQWKNLLNYVASFKVQPMYYVQVILSHVRKSRPDPQTHLHSDTFHPSVKVWLFLTDVSEDEGPFVYAPGSHIVNENRLAWEHQKAIEMSDKADILTRRGSFRIKKEALNALGYAAPQAFAVPENTLVIADTYGFHARGKSSQASTRIELWAYARRNPFLPWVGGDLLSLPVVKWNLVPLYWAGLDLLEKKSKRLISWKKVGWRYATEPAVVREK